MSEWGKALHLAEPELMFGSINVLFTPRTACSFTVRSTIVDLRRCE